MAALRNNIIIMPFGLLWNWPADYERKTAEILSEKHTVIAFLIGEGISIRRLLSGERIISSINKRLIVFKPLYLFPFQRFRVIRQLNFILAKIQLNLLLKTKPFRTCKNTIFWSFTLQFTVFPSDIHTQKFSIYDNIDGLYTDDQRTQTLWNSHEMRLLRESDLILANSSTLHKRLSKLHPNVKRTPEGLFDMDTYEKHPGIIEPDDIKTIPHPRVLFVGNISLRMDLNLIYEIAQKTPDMSYVFVGPIDKGFNNRNVHTLMVFLEKMRKLPNAFFIGRKDKSDIPAYIRHCDIGYIPYDASTVFNQNSYPMKVQEYFYLQKPVVATALGELKKLHPYIITVHGVSDAIRKLRLLKTHPWPKQYMHTQKRIALNNAIRRRLKMIEPIIMNSHEIS